MAEFQRTIKYEADRVKGFGREVMSVPGCEQLESCIQCGTCSGVCPLSIYMDYTPRQVMELVRSDFKNEVLTSLTIWLCASCYACTCECPREIRITDILYELKQRAIKEGVYHTIEIAGDHLRALYAGVPFDHFIYDSAKLGQVRNFATSPQIQIMVMTVGAINKFGDEQQAQTEEADEAARRAKSKNVMYRPSEKTGGEKPIDLIRATRPILIVDEPQSVEGGLDGKGKQAMAVKDANA
jgi:ferredoxin